jgi:hypothetical protein
MPQTYTKKDGTVSVYDKDKYNKTHKDKYADGFHCFCCNRIMNHDHSRYHLNTPFHKKRAAAAAAAAESITLTAEIIESPKEHVQDS